MRTMRWMLCAGVCICVGGLGVTACSDDAEPKSDTLVSDGGLDQGSDQGETDGPATQAQEIVILHTNDLHEHLLGFNPNADYSPSTTGDDDTVGGMARLAALIKQERTAAGDNPVLVLDAGDFLMGSLFSWLEPTEAPMPTLMQMMGYDAITLGNHEFDWGPANTAAILNAAESNGFKVPVVASNLVYSDGHPEDDDLAQLAQDGVIKNKLVLELANGVKVGLFGLLGKDAYNVAPAAFPVTTADQVETATALVKELREQDGVDLVICISHSGTDAEGKGEDADLAKAVPGIDVIISGHTHVALSQPVQVGNTLIVQTGSYGQNLGKLVLTKQGSTVSLKSYELIPVDDSIAGDTAVQDKIDGWIDDLNTILLPYDLAFDKPVAETDFDLPDLPFVESPLGDLITDSYIGVVNELNPTEPVDVAIESDGVVRSEIAAGKTGQIWFADLYRTLPLGAGPDLQPGYPLVSFYISGQELKIGMEVNALASDIFNNSDYSLQISGMQVSYDPKGSPFQRVSNIKVGGNDVDLYDTTTCYHVVTNLYVAELLGLVQKLTAGAMSVIPKEKDCTTLVNDIASKIIDRDPATPGLQELKQWQSVATFLSEQPDTDSNQIPNVPQKYSGPQGRFITP